MPSPSTTTSQPPPSNQPLSSSIYTQKSWSPDLHRDEEWIKRKGRHNHRRTKSVTDEDIDELKACIELGFGFERSPNKLDNRLSDTLPALGFYHAVNKQYFDTVSKSSSSSSSVSSCSYAVSEPDLSSPTSSPHAIFSRGDNPQTVKTRLRQWAQVVACSVRQSSSSSTSSAS